jgi:plastocyanin
MLKRGSTGRRIWLAAAVAAVATMVCAGIALASAPIIGQADDTYSAPTYTINQGEVAQLQVTGSSHNATARANGPDGKALFRSPTISGGTAGVDGTQYLPSGDYAFFCTVHPTTMQATLHVTGAGQPLARPQLNNLKLKTGTIAKAIKKGLRLTTTPNQALGGVALTAKLGKATIGRKTAALAAGFNSVVVKLSKAGKSKLRKKGKATVKVIADVPFGSPATAKRKLK